jgi:hypothetical protein
MSWADRARRVLWLRCEEASLLSSQAMDEPVSRWDRTAWWGHLIACGSCRRFRKQLLRLRGICRERVAAGEADTKAIRLSDSGRLRIAQVLLAAQNERKTDAERADLSDPGV